MTTEIDTCSSSSVEGCYCEEPSEVQEVDEKVSRLVFPKTRRFPRQIGSSPHFAHHQMLGRATSKRDIENSSALLRQERKPFGFWKKYKKIIIITGGIVLTAAAVAAITIASAGTATGAATAGGVAILSGLAEDKKDKEKSPPSQASAPISFAPPAPPIVPIEPKIDFSYQPDFNASYPPSCPVPLQLEPIFSQASYFTGESQNLAPPPIPNQPAFPEIRYEPSLNQFVDPNPGNWKYRPELAAQERIQAAAEMMGLTQPIFEVKTPPHQAPIEQGPAPERIVEPSGLTRAMFDRELWDPSITSDRELFIPKSGPLLGQMDQGQVHYHCGIGNTLDTVIEGGACLYKGLGQLLAVQPHWIHQDSLTYGLTTVILEKSKEKQTLLDPLHWPGVRVLRDGFLNRSDVARAIAYEVEQLSTKAQAIIEANNPKLKQLHIAFSNGGYVFREALKQLPPEYRNTIIVITAGSTAIIDATLACKVYNRIGSKDWPSKFCNGGAEDIAAAEATGDVWIVPQTETQAGVGGHYFTQPDYQDEITSIIYDDIVNEYEIY